MIINDYYINGYWWLLMVIDGYYINGYFVITYWWLLMVFVLVAIGGYSINGYWWTLVCSRTMGDRAQGSLVL